MHGFAPRVVIVRWQLRNRFGRVRCKWSEVPQAGPLNRSSMLTRVKVYSAKTNNGLCSLSKANVPPFQKAHPAVLQCGTGYDVRSGRVDIPSNFRL